MISVIIKVVLILSLLTLGSYQLNLKVKYHFKKLNVVLTKEQSKEIQWFISSTVTILTTLSYLLYLVLSL